VTAPGARSGAPRVLGIGGSLRADSLSFRALELVLDRVRGMGCQVEVFDVRAAPLPFCNGDKKEPWPEYPAVALLRRQVREADALVLATPEYHGGMSGVLKNVLDLLDFEHLEGKIVGAISVLGGISNCNALNDIRCVMRWCHAWVIPEQIAIGRARTVFAHREIEDPELLARFDGFAASLVRNTLRLNDRFVPAGWHARGGAAEEWPPAAYEEERHVVLTGGRG
jgi:FMN reductase